MSDQLTFDELFESELKNYPQLLVWNNLTKIISIVPAILYLIILAVIKIESPDALMSYTLRGFLYFACYGGFLKTFFELEKADLFVIVFGIGNLFFFVNNLFYTGVPSIIGILIDMVMVWIAVSVYNYCKAKENAQNRAFEFNRYQLNKKTEQAEKDLENEKKEARKESSQRASDTVKDLELNTTFSKAFEDFQKNK
ncbi:MAG: hypothetical protein MJ093_03245 [Saccharofermentans sp.]|nr:hypothetical protein [Saccharofermentans sp.]